MVWFHEFDPPKSRYTLSEMSKSSPSSSSCFCYSSFFYFYYFSSSPGPLFLFMPIHFYSSFLLFFFVFFLFLLFFFFSTPFSFSSPYSFSPSPLLHLLFSFFWKSQILEGLSLTSACSNTINSSNRRQSLCSRFISPVNHCSLCYLNTETS